MTVEEKKTCGFYHLNSAASVQRKPAVAQWEHKLDFDLFFFFLLICPYDSMNSFSFRPDEGLIKPQAAQFLAQISRTAANCTR